jgi:hypothetical protein
MTTSSNTINTKAPNLAAASPTYNQFMEQQLLGQLRTYFNQLDSFNAQVEYQTNSNNVLMWLSDC